MVTVLTEEEQIRYLIRQLESFFPDGRSLENVAPVVRRALERVEVCFRSINLPGYSREGTACFNYLHTDQYAAFLYLASNTAWKDFEDVTLASKLFALNKALNGIVCMYDTILPDIFLLMHTVGIVLGKADYSNYLVVAQNVTVGTDRGCRPTLREGVVLFGGSCIVGNTILHNDVSVSANSFVSHETIPAHSVVAGRSPSLTIKPARRTLADVYFRRSAPGDVSERE
ncbi:MAG TPA: hypothetical protein VFB21_15345 [Chthonomonadaceae bacterium]|nr:hypothetical protein [Chthonomonadaceae bacterium]